MTDQPASPLGGDQSGSDPEPLPPPVWKRTDEPDRPGAPQPPEAAASGAGEPAQADGPEPSPAPPETRRARWHASDDAAWDAAWGGQAPAETASQPPPSSWFQRLSQDGAAEEAPSGGSSGPEAAPRPRRTAGPGRPSPAASPAADRVPDPVSSPEPSPAAGPAAEDSPFTPAVGPAPSQSAPLAASASQPETSPPQATPPQATPPQASPPQAGPAQATPAQAGPAWTPPYGPIGGRAAAPEPPPPPFRESRAWQASGQPPAGPIAASTNPPLPPRTASPYQAPAYALGGGPEAPGGPSRPSLPTGPGGPPLSGPPSPPPIPTAGPRTGPEGKPKKTVTRAGAWAIAVVTALMAAGLTGGVLYSLDAFTTTAEPGPTPVTEPTPSAIEGLTSGENTPKIPDSAYDGQAPQWDVVAAAVQPTVVAIRVSAGQYSGAEGSGVIINSEKGYVVTNNHVVAVGGDIQIVLSDGRMFAASVLGTDPSTDLAVLELDNPPSDLKEAELGDSSQVVVGEPVMAVGNPLGLDNTVTTGIVSALNRPVSTSDTADYESGVPVVTNAIQVDAAVNPGNSGGPLFNAKGQVIGINSSIATLGDYSGQSGSIGLAFAIPSNQVAAVAGQLVDNGVATHPFLGVTADDAVVDVDGATRAGAEIFQVTRDTPAAEVGLQSGDVIVAVDGHSLTGSVSLTAWIRSYRPGDTVVLTVVQNGQVNDLQATLTTRDDG